MNDFEVIRRCNRAALALRDRHPDFYLPGIHVHPNFPEESCAELEEMHRRGVRWVGELVAYLMGYTGYCVPELMPVWETARDLGMVVNIHPAALEDAEALLNAFPTLKVVVAHLDSGAAGTRNRFDLIGRHANAWLDLSGSGVFRWNVLRSGIDQVGREKFLFGTDFPICSPGMLLDGIFREHLTDAERRAVLSENFLNLIG